MTQSGFLSKNLLKYMPKKTSVALLCILCVYASIITGLSITTHKAHAFIPDPTPTVNVFSLAIQPDGKILAGGMYRREGSAETARAFLVRLNSDGNLDLNFGLERIDSDILAIQSDGKILVVINRNQSFSDHDKIIRLNSDGSLDTNFNSDPDFNSIVNIAIQPDGKILISRFSKPNQTLLNNAIYRLNTDGSIDKSFNRIVLGGERPFIKNIIVQPDGKILIGGRFNNINGQSRSAIARLNSDGSLDVEFVSNAQSLLEDMAIQSDGKILIDGLCAHHDRQIVFPVIRLNPDGSCDSSFQPSSTDFLATAINVQPDGEILVGSLDYLGRIDANGSEDMSFKTYIYPVVNKIAVQDDGKVLVGGNFRYLETQKGYQDRDLHGLVRLNADGSVDETFKPWTDNLIKSIVPSDGNN